MLANRTGTVEAVAPPRRLPLGVPDEPSAAPRLE